MAEGASHCLFLCFLIVLCICSSDASQKKEKGKKELKRVQEQFLHFSHRGLFNNFHTKITQHNDVYPPPTTVPTAPVTVSPDNNPTPTIVTVPSTNPVSVTPIPNTTPVTVPSTVPVPSTNPVDAPLPITNPVTTPSTTPPVTNPVTTYPPPTAGVPATTPVTNPVAPPATVGSPAVAGQSWCVAKSGVSEASLQAALDYACGIGGADCSGIQQGESCYNPVSLQNHASYAFNSYYQKNPVQTSCNFGGSATITTTNPSTGTCIYPTSSPSSSPLTATTPSPTTSSSGGGSVPGSVTPPSVLNSSNPASGGGTTGFGETPPSFNSSTSMSTSLKPLVVFVVLATSIVTGRLVVDM